MAEELFTFLRSRKKVNLGIVLINVAVFLVLSVLGDTQDASFMLGHGACYTPLILQGEFYRLVTAMFLHFGIVHLVYNMICLLALGDILERYAGPVRYLAIYFAGGICGNLVSIVTELYLLRRGFAISAGASGGIFAVIGAVLWMVLRHRGNLGGISAKRMSLMVVLMVAQGFTEGGTDNAAHIGGLAAGFVLAALLQCGKGRKKSQRE